MKHEYVYIKNGLGLYTVVSQDKIKLLNGLRNCGNAILCPCNGHKLIRDFWTEFDEKIMRAKKQRRKNKEILCELLLGRGGVEVYKTTPIPLPKKEKRG